MSYLPPSAQYGLRDDQNSGSLVHETDQDQNCGSSEHETVKEVKFDQYYWFGNRFVIPPSLPGIHKENKSNLLVLLCAA